MLVVRSFEKIEEIQSDFPKEESDKQFSPSTPGQSLGLDAVMKVTH